ncbi:hypothetical protein CHS0354_022280 [Potamilus streckersoni]|uniref:LEM domain-containing protein n=1 Tax=Potamilus streckersoni TaxID=2493646 RepID=A0AAE0THC4_9BIVA|nr:hypothetical protein CHS0354_022280 [Potamilus streckersoni]
MVLSADLFLFHRLAYECLENGADPNLVIPEKGVSPMHIAAGLGVHATALLLQYGGDPNIRSSDGTTPVHVAAIWGEENCLKLLLANGGDPCITDEEGLNSLDLAGNPEIYNLLRRYIALLSLNKDHTLTPKYIYTRRSTDSATSSTNSSLDHVDKTVDFPYDTQDLEDYLDAAKKKPRPSLYTQEVQKHCDDFFKKGCSTYLMDVTSPDHPYFDIKSNTDVGTKSQDNDSFLGNDNSEEESLHLHVSVSDEEEADLIKTLLSSPPFMKNENSDTSGISSDSYVTCSSHLDSEMDGLNKCQTLENLEAEWAAELGNKLNTIEERKNGNQSDICRQTGKSNYSKHGLLLNSRETPSETHILNKVDDADDKFSSLNAYPATCFQKASDFNHNSSGYSSNSTCRQKFETNQVRGKLQCPGGENNTNTNHRYFEDIRGECKNCASYNNSHCCSPHNTCPYYPSLCAQNNRTIAFKNSSSTECASHHFNIHSDSPYYYHCALCSPHTYHLNKMGCTTQHQCITIPRKHNFSCFKEKILQISDKNENDDEFYGNDYHNTYKSCELVKPHDHNWRQSQNPDQIVRQSVNKDHKGRQSTNHQNAIHSRTTDVNFLGLKLQAANLHEQESPDLHDSLISNDESFFVRHKTKTVMEKKNDTHKSCGSNFEEIDIKELNILKPQQKLKVNDELYCFPDTETKNPEKQDKATNSIDSKDLIKENNNRDVNKDSEKLPTKQETRSPLEEEERLSPLDIFNKGFISNRTSISSVYSDASVTEYLYRDPEMGITLIERRISSQFGSSGRPSIDSLCSISSTHSSDSDRTVLYDWRAYGDLQIDASKVDDGIQVPDYIKRLSDDEVRAKLRLFREDPGPVTATTRQTYLVKLTQLEKDPERAKLKLTKKSPGYPPELASALEGKLDLSDMGAQEIKMIEAFQNPNKRRWREGTIKSSFNYILLDPRVTRNLPNRAANLVQDTKESGQYNQLWLTDHTFIHLSETEQEAFKIFISAIFYIGKGKRARPYSHLYEAINQMKRPQDKVSPKVYHILDIWNEDVGVVSLHCFQSVIPVEAYTREACMVDAIGLENLTNKKRGDYYGVATTWSVKQKRKMGVFILKKALQIFLAEGERQICPPDIRTGI